MLASSGMRSGDIPALLPLTHACSLPQPRFKRCCFGLCFEGGRIPRVKPKSGAQRLTVKPRAAQKHPRYLPRDHNCCESTCRSGILSQGCGLKGHRHPEESSGMLR